MAKANSTKADLIPAVGYIRMSDDRQEASPDQQRGEIIRLAERLGYRIVRWYVDAGISGDATERRLDFLRMRADIELGDFQAVLCWDQDRFGRFDPIEGGYWIKPFRDAGIKLVTVAQGVIDWNDFQGRLMYIIQQEGKHAFLRDLSRNILRGRAAGAAKGYWQGGVAPYGYSLEPIPGVPPGRNGRCPKGLVPHPIHGPVVLRIFEMYGDQGMSLREIAETLNSEGIRTIRGNKWRFDTVHRRLADEVYLGTFVWNRRSGGKYQHVASDGQIVAGPKGGKSGQTHLNQDECVLRIESNHEAIVSAELFERCQRRLAERKRDTSPYRGKSNPYMLSGLCKCGHCGGPMIGTSTTNRRDSREYVCGNYHHSGNAGCQRHFIHEAPILECLVRKLQGQFLNAGNLKALRAEIRRQCKAKKAPRKPDARRLRRRIDKLTQDIDQGAQRLLTAPDDLTSILTDTLRQWRTERDELQQQLKAAEMPHNAPEGNMAEIVDGAIAELQTLRERLNETNPALLRDVLRELVGRVDLWFTRTGGRRQCKLRRGTIHLRPDLRIVKLVAQDVTIV